MMNGQIFRVVLADDHPVVREGVASVLTKDPSFRIVAEAPSAEEAVAAVVRHRPHVLVIDVRLGDLDGIDACSRVMSEVPTTRVLVLTRFAHESVMIRSFAAGAKGFLIKESDPDVLRQAVRVVAEGGTYIDPKVAGKLIDVATRGRRARGPYGLTLMEMRVLEHLPKGLSNREIGAELSVTQETVKTHVRSILQKLQVHDRAEASAIAIREGLA